MVLFFILIGLVTGIFAGLLGIGGGAITVPALYYLFLFYDFPKELLIYLAIATSLASTLLSSSWATWAHLRRGSSFSKFLKGMVPALIVGSSWGAFLSYTLSTEVLKLAFAILAIFLGGYFFFPRLPSLHFKNRSLWILGLFGVVIGTLSTLLGIGGGILMMPVFLGYGVNLKSAVLSSSASTLVTALLGTLFYLFLGIGKTAGLPGTVGYIYIPAFLAIGLSSFFTARWGVTLSHELKTTLVRRIFGVALMLTGILMMFR